MAILGRRPSGNDIGFGYVTAASSSASRASIMGRPASNGWAYRLGGRLGYNSGSSATLQLGVYATSGGNTVTTRLATTAEFTVNAYMADAYSGADYTSTLATALQLYSNTDYALAVGATAGTGAFGQDHSGLVMHDRNAVLPDPYSASATSPQGKISLWAEYQPNRAPNRPSDLVPIPGSMTSDSTPGIGASFTDPDETLPGVALGNADKMQSYRLEVWNQTRTSRLWDTGKTTATSAHQNARRVEGTISTLAAGTYYARATFWDQFDVPSPTEEWSFTVNAGGSWANVRLDNQSVVAPGVTNSDGTSSHFGMQADWTHQNALDSSEIEFRIINAAGTVVRDSWLVAHVQTPGGTSGTLYTTTGWAPLPRGVAYRLQVRGRDSANLQTGWGTSEPFTVNAYPNAPTSLSPSGTVHEFRPELAALITDASDEPARLTPSFAVRASGDTGDGLAIPLSRTRYADGQWRATPTATEIPALGAWQWRVMATDPYGLAGPWSAWQSFTYAAAPVVTITAPAAGATLTTGTPTLTGTVDKSITQIAVTIRDARGVVVHSSGNVAAGGSSWSYAVPGALLRNNTTYAATVDVTSTEGLTGSGSVTFTVAYPAPLALANVTVNAVAGAHEPNADPTQWSRIAIAWAQALTTEVADADFRGYVVRRVDLGTGASMVIAHLAARGDTTFIDKTPRSGVAYRYDVTYLAVRNTVDVVESVAASAQGSVTLRCAVLTTMDDDDLHVPLRHWDKRDVDWVGDEEIVTAIGVDKPLAFRGATDYARLKGDFTALDDPHGTFTARDLVAAIRLMKRYRVLDDGELAPRVILYRDQRRSMFAVLTDAGESDHRSIRVGPLDLELVEVDASEEVTL